jgi:phosphatidylglycerol:prolipoprotein diacylglycerol transferase
MIGYIQAPNINPVMIDLPGPMAISWYGVMYLMGLLFAYLFVLYHIRRKRIELDNEQFTDILIRIFLGVIIGGRLGFCLFVNPSYYLRNPLRILAVWEGGMYFFGGLILAIILPYFYIRRIRRNYFDVGDLIIIPAPIALALGRLGNFINGEFWGRPSTAPWAMVFDTVPRTNWFPADESWVQEFIAAIGMRVPAEQKLVNLPRHPVQLYELFFEGVLLFFVLLLFRNIGKPKPRGSILSLFMLAYGAFRFWIEFYREPTSHSAIVAGDWFTLGMLFSVPMVLAGAAGLLLAFKYNKPNMLYISIDQSPAASLKYKNKRQRRKRRW